MIWPIRHLMRQCAAVIMVLGLVTGSFGVHAHINDGEGLGGAHHQIGHDHGSIDIDVNFGENGGDAQGGTPHCVHVHAHGDAFMLPVEGIPVISAMTDVTCHRPWAQWLPKTVCFDVETPPHILAV